MAKPTLDSLAKELAELREDFEEHHHGTISPISNPPKERREKEKAEKEKPEPEGEPKEGT